MIELKMMVKLQTNFKNIMNNIKNIEVKLKEKDKTLMFLKVLSKMFGAIFLVDEIKEIKNLRVL